MSNIYYKTFKIPVSVHRELKTLSASNGVTMIEMLSMMIVDWVKRHGVKDE